MGSIIGLIGQLQQSQSQEGQAEVAADIAGQNVVFAEERAEAIGEAGGFQLHQQRLQQQSLLARAQVAGAGAGVRVGTGSLLDFEVSAEEVFAEDRRQLEFDIESRVYEARIGAWNARNQQASALARKENIATQRPLIALGGAFNIAGEAGKLGATALGAFGNPQSILLSGGR